MRLNTFTFKTSDLPILTYRNWKAWTPMKGSFVRLASIRHVAVSRVLAMNTQRKHVLIACTTYDYCLFSVVFLG